MPTKDKVCNKCEFSQACLKYSTNADISLAKKCATFIPKKTQETTDHAARYNTTYK